VLEQLEDRLGQCFSAFDLDRGFEQLWPELELELVKAMSTP